MLALGGLVLAGALAFAWGLEVGRPNENREASPAPTARPAALEAARRYAATRRGVVSFAVTDTTGATAGHGQSRRFVAASVVKAMLLVALLRRRADEDRPLTPAGRLALGEMIRESDNETATAVWREVGDAGLRRLAADAGMSGFVLGPKTIPACRCRARRWARAQITAADQARFFLAIARYVPPRFRAYALSLLGGIVPSQRWGLVEPAQEAGFRPYFKVGVRVTGLGLAVHQAALLVRGDRRLGVAVLTDGNPSESYGRETVRRLGQILLRPTGSR